MKQAERFFWFWSLKGLQVQTKSRKKMVCVKMCTLHKDAVPHFPHFWDFEYNIHHMNLPTFICFQFHLSYNMPTWKTYLLDTSKSHMPRWIPWYCLAIICSHNNECQTLVIFILSMAQKIHTARECHAQHSHGMHNPSNVSVSKMCPLRHPVSCTSWNP